MSLEAWQTALRRQFGREQRFILKNVGDHPIFSEYQVTDPKSGSSYRVAIRGGEPGSNFCACPDFATNTLGTCKHIEFTLGRLERKPGARAGLARGWAPLFGEVYVRYGARREVRFRPGTGAPEELKRLAARYFDAGGVLRPDAFAQFDTFLAKAARLDPRLRCYEDALGLVAQVRDAERRSAVLHEAFPRGIRSGAFKDLLRVPLYDYQREAALFAARTGRCIIADEMGLGKTIEAIAAIEIMARHFGVERVLVVGPTSLKHQWEREIARVVARSALVVGGFPSARAAAFRAESFSEADQRRLTIALQNMRMACDSTYLLDQSADHGVKADELVTLLDEIFQEPDAKVVVFSQWVRMHEILVRRIERRRWGHVLFHGGVEAARRKTLIDRFREDPRCRAFLSTDAGGVGLNLRHAAVVVNVDLPWNPAVLEQRIGRVHRLGQARPVRVLSFVAQGTIEEGILSILGFKRSLFAGALDGGASEVFLGGSRLKRFMDSVEQVTTGIPVPAVEEAPSPEAEDTAGNGEGEPPKAAAAPHVDPWAGLLQTGLELLGRLAAGSPGRADDGGASPPLFERVRDEQTGRNYLKIPMPEPDVVDRLTGALQALLETMRA